MRNADGELHHLEPALQFAARIGKDLAVLAADQRREFGGVHEAEFAELEQDARAIEGRTFAPGGRGGVRVGDDALDIRCVGEGHISRVPARSPDRTRGRCVPCARRCAPRRRSG